MIITPTRSSSNLFHVLLVAIACLALSKITCSSAFGSGTTARHSPLFSSSAQSRTSLASTAAPQQKGNKKKPYVPKWVKKGTLADTAGDINSIGFAGVGLKGTIPVVFKQGNETKTSMAWAGQPIRDVASQAGQYIQYSCGKGECGTCECMMNGKWVRPCVETVPANALEKGELVLQIKAVKAKASSSGTFFSIRSFLMGFWNNILGMLGFVQFRKKAGENFDERKAYEDLVAQKVMQKKLARQNGATPGMA